MNMLIRLLVFVSALLAMPASAVNLGPNDQGIVDPSKALRDYAKREAERQLASLAQSGKFAAAIVVVAVGPATGGPTDSAASLLQGWHPKGRGERLVAVLDQPGHQVTFAASDGLKLIFPPEALRDLGNAVADDALHAGDLDNGVDELIKGLQRLAERHTAKIDQADNGQSLPAKRDKDGRVAVPALAAPVTDLTATLLPSEIAELGQRLFALQDQTKAQVAILLVPTTQPEAIEQYSLRVAETWKLGLAKADNGVLVLVAKDDRRMRIEVGYGLEGALNDATAKRIISEQITPLFKRDDYAGGLKAGIERIAAVIRTEPVTSQAAAAAEEPFDIADTLALWIASVFGLIFGMVLRNRKPAVASPTRAALTAAGASMILGLVLGLFMGGPFLALLAGIVTFIGVNLTGTQPRQTGTHESWTTDTPWWPSGGYSGGGHSSRDYSGGGGRFGGGGASGSW